MTPALGENDLALPLAGFLFSIRGLIDLFLSSYCMRLVTCNHYRLRSACLLSAVIMVAAPGFSQESIPTGPGPDASSFHAAVSAGTGWRMFTGALARDWNPYPFTSITLDLPTGLKTVFFRVSGDGGMVSGHDPSLPDRLLTLHESIAGVIDLVRIKSFTFRTALGVSSATIFFTPSFELDAKPFSTSESEFGLTAGVEAVWRHKRFQAAVPVSFDGIFSLPHPLLFLTAGIAAGGVF